MLVGGVEKLAGREGHGRGVEDAAGDVDEGNNEDELERIDDVVADLRGRDIEAKDEGYGEAEDGGAADDGVDADEQTGGDAPGQLFWRCSHAQQSQDGKGDAAIDPVVVDGSGTGMGLVATWFVRMH